MRIPESIKLAANNLRNNSTKAEVILWNYLKNGKLWEKFLRQKPVYVYTENNWLDRFIIADFLCFERKIIIEVDWNIHDLEEIYNLDKHKESLLKNLWYKVLRIRNEEIYDDIENGLEKIRDSFK